MNTYYIEFWDVNGKVKKSKRENSHTDQIDKVRRRLVREIGTKTKICGGVFKGKDITIPMGFVFYDPESRSYIWSTRNPKTLEIKDYTVDENGRITPL